MEQVFHHTRSSRLLLYVRHTQAQSEQELSSEIFGDEADELDAVAAMVESSVQQPDVQDVWDGSTV